MIAVRHCWIVQSAVGCSVTFQWTIRRVPTSSTTNTYRMRKRTVIVVPKAREDRVRVIPHERGPALGGSTTAGRSQAPEIMTHRARRDGQAQFQQEFVSDP